MTSAMPGPIEPTRPPVIDRAIQLIWIVVGIDVFAALVGFLITPPSEIVTYDPTLGLTVDEYRIFAYTVLVFSVALVVGLWVWMAIKIRQGRGWARVLGTVLYGFNAFCYLAELMFTFTGGTPLLSLALSSITFGMSTYILVLIWRPESTLYFQHVRWQQLQAVMPRPSF